MYKRQEVTREQVIAAANALRPGAVFLLAGAVPQKKGGAEDEE